MFLKKTIIGKLAARYFPASRIFLCGLVFVSLLFSAVVPAAVAQTKENVQVFGSEPMANEKSKGKNLAGCLAGWRQFISAGLGYEGFIDYWRDLWIGIRWPMYYSDIINVEDQVNKARYEVMEAFMNCAVDRLKPVTDAYYRLEAELYFVRHYVDATDGIIRSKLDASEEYNFVQEMIDYFVIRKSSEDPEKDKALFSGYFDLFKGKYSSRAAKYTNYGEDPVWGSLIDKFTELVDTLKGFGEMGSEFADLGGETWAAASEGVSAVGGVITSPVSSLKNLAKGAYNAFQVCPETGNQEDKCMTFGEATAKGGAAVWEGAKTIGGIPYAIGEDIVNWFNDYVLRPPGTTTESGAESGEAPAAKPVQNKKKMTWTDYKKTVDEMLKLGALNAERAEMLTRYEVLYGQISGEGTIAVTNKMDNLIKVLGDGSLPPLEQLAACAKRVQGSVCSDAL